MGFLFEKKVAGQEDDDESKAGNLSLDGLYNRLSYEQEAVEPDTLNK